MTDSTTYFKLVNLLKAFKNREHTLALLLLRKDALTSKFENTIKNAELLKDDNYKKINTILTSGYNGDVLKLMDKLDDLFVYEINEDATDTTINAEEKFNNMLSKAVSEQDFEYAAKIRDYMATNNITNRMA